MSTCSYRWAFVDPSDALKYVADPALTTYTNTIDALKHATSSFVIVAYGNRVVAAVNADDPLREFACNVALSRLHEWDAPDVVKEYLTTRNPDLREAARNAVWDVIQEDARDAARDAAWAARDAARAAARSVQNAAWAAAWAAARDADQLDMFLLNRLGLLT